MHRYLDVSPEVAEALASGKAVVALESTIISHGMPYPQNVETAFRVEKVVRDAGAVPATIAIMGGRLKVGLDAEAVRSLGKKGRDAVKVSRRDIAWTIANRLDGATTVAATMILAAMAGVRVFATGGIGGVHRGAERTMDISADLEELAATDVAVVCAGAKSILDLSKTLEYLETRGVPVIGFRTREFPAFYTSRSGMTLEMRAEEPADIARFLRAKRDLGLSGGVVIANPIPPEFEMEASVIGSAIDRAVAEAEAQGIRGKETTPFLLARVKELTGGESLESNIALVLNNAKLAAMVAVELASLA
ncbi:MAG: pseudouridine-5'-phosphate glycosidase [Spirochaetes bacterium]|nr:pseudouridine-5'-phosphate glycosidase [Spirochaetota bacterium]